MKQILLGLGALLVCTVIGNAQEHTERILCEGEDSELLRGEYMVYQHTWIPYGKEYVCGGVNYDTLTWVQKGRHMVEQLMWHRQACVDHRGFVDENDRRIIKSKWEGWPLAASMLLKFDDEEWCEVIDNPYGCSHRGFRVRDADMPPLEETVIEITASGSIGSSAAAGEVHFMLGNFGSECGPFIIDVPEGKGAPEIAEEILQQLTNSCVIQGQIDAASPHQIHLVGNALSFRVRPDADSPWCEVIGEGAICGDAVVFTEGAVTDVADSYGLRSGDVRAGVYPHPVRGRAYVRFEVNEPAPVSLEVYDALGRRALSYPARLMNAGTQQLSINAQRLDKGVYAYALRVGTELIRSSFMVGQ